MASTIMMQSMCNNQTIDLGMFGSQTNQVNGMYNNQSSDLGTFGSQTNQVNYFFDPHFASSPAVSPEGLPGGAMLMNPQTLSMPAMNYSASTSPQMMPMAYPAISPPPMMPMMNMPSISPSPLAPMGSLVPAMPMMGYSIIPIPQGMTIMGLPPQASASYSPENMGFLLPEMAVTPPYCSISRSCSPVSDVIFPEPFNDEQIHIEEVSRERLLSSASSGSLDSSGIISKKELVENCLHEVDQIFGERVQTTGMRGPTVMRIKVKTRPSLELIVDLLRALEQHCNIIAISCPKSTKKGKQHIRGFLAYIQTNAVSEIAQVQSVFDEFNQAHMNGEVAPFKTLEINPQKKK